MTIKEMRKITILDQSFFDSKNQTSCDSPYLSFNTSPYLAKYCPNEGWSKTEATQGIHES
jgi:hypothetical protein